MSSIRYQLTAARFPIHRDLTGFDSGLRCVDPRLVDELGYTQAVLAGSEIL